MGKPTTPPPVPAQPHTALPPKLPQRHFAPPPTAFGAIASAPSPTAQLKPSTLPAPPLARPAQRPPTAAPAQPPAPRPAAPLATPTVQAKAAPDAATGDGVIQRVRIGLVNGNITASHIRRSRRVAGGLRNGGQGDHTTAYLSMQHMIVNAVNNLAPEDAHDNLVDTHLAMMNYPGYAQSPQWLRNQSQNRLAHEQGQQGGAITLGQVRDYGSFLLQLRNRMALSSLPTTGGSTGNHAEQQHGGGLQQEEQRLQNGQPPRYARRDILISMVALCDTRRIRRSVQSVARQNDIALQHGMSMVQSYPTICQQHHITAQEIRVRVTDLL